MFLARVVLLQQCCQIRFTVLGEDLLNKFLLAIYDALSNEPLAWTSIRICARFHVHSGMSGHVHSVIKWGPATQLQSD